MWTRTHTTAAMSVRNWSQRGTGPDQKGVSQPRQQSRRALTSSRARASCRCPPQRHGKRRRRRIRGEDQSPSPPDGVLPNDREDGAVSFGKASTICWAVHSAVGCSVTFKGTTRRRWWASTTRTKNTRRLTVGTVKKSRATRSRRWLARNVRQVWDGGVCRFGRSRETVRSATSIPSFCSSPWIRGAPHRGFAAAIRVTRAVISALTGGRPPVGRLESLVQCARKRRRCHRNTVSGATITRAALHSVQTLASQTHRRRSVRRSRGRVTVLLYTASWWRKARFSRANCRWPPQRNGKRRSRWSSVVIMERDSGRIRD